MWYVDTIALSLFTIGQPMIVLYAEGMSTIINLANIILKQGLFPNVMYNFMVLSGKIESLVNPINEEVIRVISYLRAWVYENH